MNLEKYSKFKEKFYNENLYKEALGFELTEKEYQGDSVYDIDYKDSNIRAYYIKNEDLQIKLNAFGKITSMYIVGEKDYKGILVTGILKNFQATFEDFLESNLFTKAPFLSSVTATELIEYNMKLSDISRIVYSNFKDSIVTRPTFIDYDINSIGSAYILNNVNSVVLKKYEFGGYEEMIDNLDSFKYIYRIRFNSVLNVYYVYGLSVEDYLNA